MTSEDSENKVGDLFRFGVVVEHDEIYGRREAERVPATQLDAEHAKAEERFRRVTSQLEALGSEKRYLRGFLDVLGRRRRDEPGRPPGHGRRNA